MNGVISPIFNSINCQNELFFSVTLTLANELAL